jgi:hypothetical protein
MGNPHPPWGNNSPVPGLGIYQWMEVNLVIGNPEKPDLNASGVVLMGAPFIGIGYSDEIGWTHTDNTIQNTNLYELTLNPNGTSARVTKMSGNTGRRSPSEESLFRGRESVGPASPPSHLPRKRGYWRHPVAKRPCV